MSCSLSQEPCQSRCSCRRLTQMEGRRSSLPPGADGGAAPCRVIVQRRRGLTGSGIPSTHGSAQEEGQRRRVHEEGRQQAVSSRAGGGGSPDQAASASEVRRVPGSNRCGTMAMQRGERSSIFALPLSSVAKMECLLQCLMETDVTRTVSLPSHF
jgi:hypothetical protein